MKNYLTLYANGADLVEKKAQHASAGFSYRKSLILFFASLNISYDRIAANKIASAIVTNNLQQQVMLPYANTADLLTVNSTVSKCVFPLRTTFSAGFQWQGIQSVQLQNDQLLPFNTITETGSFGADFKAGDHLAIGYRAKFMQTASHSAVDASASHVGQLQQTVALEYDPLTNLQFKLSGEDYFTRQQGNPDLKFFLRMPP